MHVHLLTTLKRVMRDIYPHAAGGKFGQYKMMQNP